MKWKVTSNLEQIGNKSIFRKILKIVQKINTIKRVSEGGCFKIFDQYALIITLPKMWFTHIWHRDCNKREKSTAILFMNGIEDEKVRLNHVHILSFMKIS